MPRKGHTEEQVAACRDLTGEFVRRPLSESPVRTALIVFSSPSLDRLLRLGRRGEPVGIQTFGPECSVEGFYVGVVGRLSRSREVNPHATVVRPEVQVLTREL